MFADRALFLHRPDRWRRRAARRFGTALPLVLLLAFLPAGCSRDSRLAVTGTVTLDGKPLAAGIINFRPADGTTANSAGGAIAQGRFEVPADKGLPPGRYLVSIQPIEETGRMVDDPLMGRVPERLLVPVRQTDNLEATLEPGGANHFEFHLNRAR